MPPAKRASDLDLGTPSTPRPTPATLIRGELTPFEATEPIQAALQLAANIESLGDPSQPPAKRPKELQRPAPSKVTRQSLELHSPGLLFDQNAVSYGLDKLIARITHPLITIAAYVVLGYSVTMFAVAYMRAMATATVYGETILYGALPQHPERLAELRKGDKVSSTNPRSAFDIDLLGGDLVNLGPLTPQEDLLFETLVSRILGYQRASTLTSAEVYEAMWDRQAARVRDALLYVYEQRTVADLPQAAQHLVSRYALS
ncbi:hypothetical protein WJX72_002814 [[Myrmecia] bisecta]|uniref:Uncharacterized protein n=1 Tax=[Myrmecia] bisecta TaxID=41462 RepID=A0AAW1R635_9CHLO